MVEPRPQTTVQAVGRRVGFSVVCLELRIKQLDPFGSSSLILPFQKYHLQGESEFSPIFSKHVTVVIVRTQDPTSNNRSWASQLSYRVMFSFICLFIDSFTYSLNKSTKLPPGEQTACLRVCAALWLWPSPWPLCSLQKLMSVNYLGSVYASRAVITTMKERRVGRIVFLSSQAGQVGLFGFTAYSPSKFAIRGLAEALQMEVSTVCGFTLLPVSSADVPLSPVAPSHALCCCITDL